jgi:cysteine-rich repeat protein
MHRDQCLARHLGLFAKTGLAAILVLAGITCASSSRPPGGGTGGTPDASSPIASSGGTGGTQGFCNATSTVGCHGPPPEACGDGINNQGGTEECDDGNVLPGDGCSGVCRVEPGWTCPLAGLFGCKRVVSCADGMDAGGEPCDGSSDGSEADGIPDAALLSI